MGVNTGLHSGYKLNQNYPNPFNGKTTITYHLSKSSNNFVKDIGYYREGIRNPGTGNFNLAGKLSDKLAPKKN